MKPRLAAAGLVAPAVVLGAVALAAAVGYSPRPGLDLDPQGARVTYVLPGGPTWNDGIRVGHDVVSVTPEDAADDWQLVTTDGFTHFASPASSHRAALRNAVAGGAAATGLSLLAVLALTRMAWKLSGALAVAAVALASWPLGLTGEQLASGVALSAAPLLPSMWMAKWGAHRRLALLGLLVVAALTAFWNSSRALAPDGFEWLEAIRLMVVWVGATGVSLLVVPWSRWLGQGSVVESARSGDLAGLGLLLGVAAGVSLVLDLPVIAIGAVGGALVLVYPRARQVVLALAERVLFSDVRAKASIAATEEERSRLSREIHDVPLQEIAGVVRRLDTVEGKSAEAELLRDVAAHLRLLTTELRPPVLDDLGLGAAIEFAGDGASRDAPPDVVVRVDDQAGVLPTDRPRPEIELAVFRIVQEAVANAQTHAEASTIKVTATIARTRIEVAVEDDGRGIQRIDALNARRRGRLGLSSMQQRAEAIGADLVVGTGDGGGTSVRLVWEAHR